MGTAPSPIASNQQFTIDKSFTFSGDSITLDLDLTKNPAVVQAILQNSAFPPGDIALGDISVNLQGSAGAVTLGDSSRGSVAFDFAGGGSYELQVLADPAAVLLAVSPHKNIAAGIDLGAQTGDRYLLLKLNYDIGVTARGTVALATGLTANFGATGSRSGDWSVIRRFAQEGAFDVLKDTFAAWILPRQFDGVDRLRPGTCLVMEVDGSIALSLGVQAGYDFSWIRKLTDGTLTGDLGLKVELAATAALGFSANGSYALALSRPDETNKIRLALFKLAKKGWNFALNASAGVRGVLPPALRQSTDVTDLAKAIFGVQINQLLNDLSLARKVAAGGLPTDQAATFLVALGEKELGASGIDVDRLYNAGVDRANTLLNQLNTLGQRATNVITSLLSPDAKQDLAKLTDVLTQIQGVGQDPSKIGGIIQTELQQVAFFQTGFGRFLSSVATTTPFAALLDPQELSNIGQLAGLALNVLNGQGLQDLIDFAKDKLNLQPLPSLAQADQWLQSKISAFLGKAVPQLVQADLQKVQDAVSLVFSKADQFFAEAIQAAQKHYEATFVATYQQSSTNTALLDVIFDFDANPDILQIVKGAIDGDFTGILLDPSVPGVSVNNALLTHGINRQAHVELTLPFVDMGTSTLTDTLASVSPQNDGSGRVLLYQSKSSNDVTSFVKARSQRDGQMTLAMTLKTPPPAVTKHPDFSADFGYALRAANLDTGKQQLLARLQPIVETYMPGVFPPEAGLDVWIDDLDQVIETSPTGRLGETLLTLDVAVPSAALAVWLSVSPNKKDISYFILSKRIQERVRRLISSVYFALPNRYDNLGAAYPLVTYSAMRSANSFDVNSDGAAVFTKNDLYWDQDMEHITALLNDTVTQANVRNSLQSIARTLTRLGDNKAQFYQPENLQAVLAAALQRQNPSSRMPDLLGGLIFFESQMIDAVMKAAIDLAKFLNESITDPSAAVKTMGIFGDDIVRAFNSGLSGELFAGPELSALGSALFMEISQALAESILPAIPPHMAPTALVSISIPKPGANLSPSDLVAGNFKQDDIFVEQKLTSA